MLFNSHFLFVGFAALQIILSFFNLLYIRLYHLERISANFTVVGYAGRFLFIGVSYIVFPLNRADWVAVAIGIKIKLARQPEEPVAAK